MTEPKNLCSSSHHEPNAEQLEQLKALNRRMQKACTTAYNQMLEVDKKLSKRLKDKGDPLKDFELQHFVIFYHKKTNAILAIYEDWFWPGIHNEEETVIFGRDGNFNWHMPFDGLENECLSPWFGRLIDFYHMRWYELLNIGQIKIEYEIQYQYAHGINEEMEFGEGEE